MSLLEISHLKKAYDGRVAVDDLSFSVEAGEIFGLLGPNGAGKSTAMMVVAGLREADSGTITIDGHPSHNGDPRTKFVLGVVPQDLAVYPDLTARENLEFFGSIYGIAGEKLRQRVDAVFDEIGLAEHADQYARTFSGGMKRRLNFGAGLLHEPRLVILDEPTVGVDPQSRSHLLDCVQKLASGGVAVIYVSHYMEEVEAICHRVAIMDRGKLLACKPIDELLDKSRADLYVHVAAKPDDLKSRLLGLAEIEAGPDHDSRVIVRRERRAPPGAVSGKLAAVLEVLASAKLDLISIETREHNLERLFLEMTGRKLRD